MLDEIIQVIHNAGGRAFYVGGCVRDEFLGIESKDLDVEVFNLSAGTLSSLLKRFGKVSEVGVSFGVIKLLATDGTDFDFTLPRRENKTGFGHRGFQVAVDHTMSVEEAAARRDFTINAIYRCALSHEIHDPYNGAQDLEQRILKATSPKFAEDPLRVLRGFQLASRFGLQIDKATAFLANSLISEYPTLAIERVWGEWQKWALRSRYPSQGLEVLNRSGWIDLYPELAALKDVPQDPEWHPEGDVWVHTQLVCDAAARIAIREELSEQDRTVLMLSALCHDLGKATTTEFIDGRWRAHGHCEAGVPLTRSFLERIGCPETLIEVIEPLVVEHLAHANPACSLRAVRRLSNRLGKASIRQLIHLIEADMSGRPPLPGGLPESANQLIKIAQDLELQDNKPEPIILGRHLIALGHSPNVWFSDVLRECFEAQLDGEFESEETGILFLKKLLVDL